MNSPCFTRSLLSLLSPSLFALLITTAVFAQTTVTEDPNKQIKDELDATQKLLTEAKAAADKAEKSATAATDAVNKLEAASKPAVVIIESPLYAGATEVQAVNGEAGKTYKLLKNVKVDEAGSGIELSTAKTATDKSLTFSVSALHKGDILRVVEETASASSKDSLVTVEPSVTMPQGVQTRMIVGYQQGGANSSDSAGRVFLDIYTSRPLPFKTMIPLRWTGNIRVGSSSVDATSTVGKYVAGFSGSIGSLQLNQIASVAEFVTGFEHQLNPPSENLEGQSENMPQRFILSGFVFYGASGYLQNSELNQTFAFPANNTQAYALLVNAEASNAGSIGSPTTIPTTCNFSASSKIPNVADNCQFIQFHKQQPYFPQQLYGGLKLASYNLNKSGAWSDNSPAQVSIGFGGNQAITRNLRLNTVKIEGFVPMYLPASNAAASALSHIYLFGTCNLALNHDKFINSGNYIPLDPISKVTINNLVVTPGSANTYVISSRPTPQETYSIGVGVDLLKFLPSLFRSNK